MAIFGQICLWLICGMVMSIIAWILKAPMSFDSMKFLLPICITLLSFNFAACSACSNALLKFKELHPDKDITSIIQEMKESIIAMVIGVFVILFSLFTLNYLMGIESSVKTGLIIGVNGFIFSVFIMYVWLIYDIAMAFFELIGNNK